MTDLGDRMKRYEISSQLSLTRRTPVIIRIDGRAFHTYARHADKPFDNNLSRLMQYTTKQLCKEVSGCVFGYSQSDEISLLLIDYQQLNTEAWFDYNVQKLTSITASIATAEFNEARFDLCLNEFEFPEFATFDSRSFNIPEDDVVNYMVWRQRDAIRNSIQSLAQANYSQKQLNGISTADLIVKLREEKGIEWLDLPIIQQRGFAVKNNEVDINIPIFSQNREWFKKSELDFN